MSGSLSRAILRIVVPLLMPASMSSAAVQWWPHEIYAGMNVITISSSSGIARIDGLSDGSWRSLKRGLSFTNVRVASVSTMSGCPRQVKLYLFVPLVSKAALLGIRITECDGGERLGALSSRELWNVERVSLGVVNVGQTTCRSFQVRNEDEPHIVDRVVSQSPRFRIQFTATPPPVRIGPRVIYRYNVCFTGDRPGTYRVPIHVYIRRNEPAGGFDSFIVADTAIVTVLGPVARAPVVPRPRPPARPRQPRVVARPPAITIPIPRERPTPEREDASIARVAARAIDPVRLAPPEATAPDVPPAAVVVAPERRITDPTAFRIVILPTARSVPEGEWFVASYDVAGLIAGYGVSDRLTVNAGGLVVPSALGADILDGTAGARYEFARVGYLRAAAGLQLNLSHSDSSSIVLAAPYIVTSVGDDDNRFSLALGFTRRRHMPGSEAPFYRSAFVLAGGGDLRVGDRWKVVAEGSFLQESAYQPVVLTVRHFTETWAVDAGAAVNLGSGGPKVAPIVGLVWVW